MGTRAARGRQLRARGARRRGGRRRWARRRGWRLCGGARAASARGAGARDGRARRRPGGGAPPRQRGRVRQPRRRGVLPVGGGARARPQQVGNALPARAGLVRAPQRRTRSFVGAPGGAPVRAGVADIDGGGGASHLPCARQRAARALPPRRAGRLRRRRGQRALQGGVRPWKCAPPPRHFRWRRNRPVRGWRQIHNGGLRRQLRHVARIDDAPQ
mmetsp:Transcript_7362/g.29916  ORF Transcript_7362/g.29916 Transcript_7362/m.29916 type:complete len:215 (+) Transcript_7362:340-984(+)